MKFYELLNGHEGTRIIKRWSLNEIECNENETQQYLKDAECYKVTKTFRNGYTKEEKVSEHACPGLIIRDHRFVGFLVDDQEQYGYFDNYKVVCMMMTDGQILGDSSYEYEGHCTDDDPYHDEDPFTIFFALHHREIDGTYKDMRQEVPTPPNPYYSKDLKHLFIPHGTTIIPDNRFKDDRTITDVTISDTVTEFGEYAFSGCFSIRNVYYEGTLEQWCNILFANSSSNPLCYNARLYIDGKPLDECLRIPEGITTITKNAFSGAQWLEAVILPKSLKELWGNPFCETSISKIVIPGSVKKIEEGTFSRYKDKNEVEIILSEGVKKICRAAFYNLKKIHVSLPSGISEIAAGAFSECVETEIDYADTIEQWNALTQNGNVKLFKNRRYLGLKIDSIKTTIHCTDGDIAAETDLY